MVDEYALLAAFRRIALVGKSPDQSVRLQKDCIRDLLKVAIDGRFDEAWYLSRYQDVAEAVKKGTIASGLDHYVSVGVYEARIPYPLALDQPDYLKRHADVARSVKQGPYQSAADHFYAVGFREGRAFQFSKPAERESAYVTPA